MLYWRKIKFVNKLNKIHKNIINRKNFMIFQNWELVRQMKMYHLMIFLMKKMSIIKKQILEIKFNHVTNQK